MNINTIENKNASENGKSLVIICGTHGNESNAVLTVFHLRDELYNNKFELPSTIKSVTFVMGWNTPGLKYNSREVVNDTESYTSDLNRDFFIDNKDDNFSLGSAVEEIKDIVNKNDIIVDVHNSEVVKNDVLLNNDRFVRFFVDFCTKHEVQYIVRESDCNTIKKYANNTGKVGFTVEINNMGFTTKQVLAENLNFMKHLVTTLGDIQSPKTTLEMLPATQEAVEIYSHTDGIIIYNDEKDSPLDLYKEGELIAFVVDFSGKNVLERISAPCDGWLMTADTSYIAPASSRSIFTFQPVVTL